MDKIRIALVDDHKIFLDGIVSLLEDCNQIAVIHIATSASGLLKKLDQESDIDVLLTDVSMDEMNGDELCVHLKKQYPRINILVLSMHKEIAVIHKVLEAGALGYLLKNTNKSELIAAIKAVSQKKVFYSEVIKEAIMKYANEEKKKDFIVEEQLTKRELDVVRLIASEYTTQEIADELCISPHTVESHRKNTLRKTHSRNIAGLIKYAINHNLLKD
ncbi:MAG: response regulator transcription factor [Bacteroidota bacterium]